MPKNGKVHKFNKVEEVLEEKTEIKNSDSSKFNGLIIGGKYNHEENCDYRKNCRLLFKKIKKFFEKNKISHSIIWGQRLGGEQTNIYYSGKDDTWTMNTDAPLTNSDDLKKAYKFISISDKDELYIHDKKISREELEVLKLTT